MLLLNREEFLNVLKSSASALGDNSKDPATCSFRLFKFKDGLYVRASTRQQFSHVFLKHDSFSHVDDFDVLVPGKPFLGFLSDIKDEQIQLSYKGNDIKVKTDSRKVKFMVSDPATVGFPEFPKLPGKDDTEFNEFDSNPLYNSLNFVKEYTKDSSGSTQETVLELRGGKVVGGSSTGLAVWSDETLAGEFILKSYAVKRLMPFLRSAGDGKVFLYTTDKYTHFKLENGWFFSCLGVNSTRRLGNVENVYTGQEYTAEAVLSKTLISSEIKALRHTLDDKVTNVSLTLIPNKGSEGGICTISFSNSKGRVSSSNIPCDDMSLTDGGSDVTFGVEYRMFLDVLKTFDKDNLRFEVYNHLNNVRIIDKSDKVVPEAILRLRS